MQIELNDRDRACLAFMIDQTARQIPFLKQSAGQADCAALDELAIDIDNLLSKLVIQEHLDVPPAISATGEPYISLQDLGKSQ
jgi:hypothetical protein